MKIKSWVWVILLIFSMSGSASALIVTSDTFYTEGAAIQALNDWRGAFDYTLLETFEGFAPEVPVGGLALENTPTSGKEVYASFGGATFYVDGGLPGAGQMRLQNASNFGVMDRNVALYDNYGRTLKWEKGNSWFGSQYLDSGDVSRISLNHNLAGQKRSNLFFFMFDVSDIDGTMIVYMDDGSIQIIGGLVPPQANGGITFMGIEATADNYISKITWEMTSDNDGFGLDNIGTLTAVPLPASVLLLGTGLLGLGVCRRRKA